MSNCYISHQFFATEMKKKKIPWNHHTKDKYYLSLKSLNTPLNILWSSFLKQVANNLVEIIASLIYTAAHENYYTRKECKKQNN